MPANQGFHASVIPTQPLLTATKFYINRPASGVTYKARSAENLRRHCITACLRPNRLEFECVHGNPPQSLHRCDLLHSSFPAPRFESRLPDGAHKRHASDATHPDDRWDTCPNRPANNLAALRGVISFRLGPFRGSDSDGWFRRTSRTKGRQRSLSSAFLAVRQAAILPGSGMNSRHSRTASDVQARRSSMLPCAKACNGKDAPATTTATVPAKRAERMHCPHRCSAIRMR